MSFWIEDETPPRRVFLLGCGSEEAMERLFQLQRLALCRALSLRGWSREILGWLTITRGVVEITDCQRSSLQVQMIIKNFKTPSNFSEGSLKALDQCSAFQMRAVGVHYRKGVPSLTASAWNFENRVKCILIPFIYPGTRLEKFQFPSLSCLYMRTFKLSLGKWSLSPCLGWDLA